MWQTDLDQLNVYLIETTVHGDCISAPAYKKDEIKILLKKNLSLNLRSSVRIRSEKPHSTY